jgi:hypothetical protein
MLLLLGSAALPAAEAKLEVNPSIMEHHLRKSGTVTLTFPEAIGKNARVRGEIISFWWCWDIDPPPADCAILDCSDPGPKDPLCPRKTKTLEDGTVQLEFDGPGLLKEVGSTCGPVSFSIMARLEDGSRTEVQGEVTIECEK